MPLLAHFSFDARTEVYKHTSKYWMEAILSQEQANGIIHAVVSASQPKKQPITKKDITRMSWKHR